MKIVWIIWTVWCGLVFLILNCIGFVFFYCFLISNTQKGYHWAHYIPTIIGRICAILWGVRVEVIGRELFSASAQYIFVGNHRSFLDAILAGGYIYNPKKFIGKAEILKWPFLGFILRKIYIPVQRNDPDSRKKSSELLLEKMKEGYSMVVFAEGKTNTSLEPLLPFKDGAFRTSCDTSVPILPFVMINADGIMPRTTIMIKPGKVKIIFLPPIHPKEAQDDDVQELKNMCYKEMEVCYASYSQTPMA
jgi:1-acyl-sn-glycerol-3-phosphate acyltransferase